MPETKITTCASLNSMYNDQSNGNGLRFTWEGHFISALVAVCNRLEQRIIELEENHGKD